MKALQGTFLIPRIVLDVMKIDVKKDENAQFNQVNKL